MKDRHQQFSNPFKTKEVQLRVQNKIGFINSVLLFSSLPENTTLVTLIQIIKSDLGMGWYEKMCRSCCQCKTVQIPGLCVLVHAIQT